MTNDRHTRVKEIFLAACELPVAEQAAWVERQCGDDPELLAEVQSLLKHHTSKTIVARPTIFDTPRGTSLLSGTLTSIDTPEAARFLYHIKHTLFGKRRRSNLLRSLIVASVLIGLIGWWAQIGTKRALQELLQSELTTRLGSNIDALRLWVRDKQLDSQLWARQASIRSAATSLADASRTASDPRELILAADAYQQLQTALSNQPRGEADVGFFIVDPEFFVLAGDREPIIGRRLQVERPNSLTEVFDGETVVAMPTPSGVFSFADKTQQPPPSVWIMTPIYREDEAPDADNVVAALCLGYRADAEFSQILVSSRSGRTGENYVFNRSGLLLSASRFEEQLKQIGMIPSGKQSSSIFQIEVRDPGRNLLDKPPSSDELPIERPPLTVMAAAATAGGSGIDTSGYRDYRGVKVIGAWEWLDDYDIGIASEIDYDEAYAPLRYMTRGIWLATIAVVVILGGVLLSALRFAQLKPGDAIAAPVQLGQYTLEEKIGEGGTGVVYKARHAMLQRPTAIKLLKPQAMTDEAKARFEREVQLATRLTHPNTIDIYDYGSTDDGTYYYAMEFLNGLSLADVIELDGAMLESRAVYILRQICGSLGEAHDIGLVHRDIKPLNIMLCAQGGMTDFVKVLDFGLAKQVQETQSMEITAPLVVHGTPMYIAPERIRDTANTDIRSDIYSLGAVAFNLVTGKHVFDAETEVELLYKVMNEPTPDPASVASGPLDPELNKLIRDCLAKSPNDRPQSAAEVGSRLDRMRGIKKWTQADAKQWWEKNRARVAAHRAVSASALNNTPNQGGAAMQQNTPLADVDLGSTQTYFRHPISDQQN